MSRVRAMLIPAWNMKSDRTLRPLTAKKFIEGGFTAIGFTQHKFYWCSVSGEKVTVSQRLV